MKAYFLLTFCVLIMFNSISGQQIIPLWPDKIPNQKETDEAEIEGDRDIHWIENVQEPTLEVYCPTARTATDVGVIICPGGGYSGLAYDWEGTDIAKWFNTKGITAFVLKYRLPNSKSIIIPHQAPLQDALQAIKLIKEKASEWKLSAEKIGVMGFSAGGHLAASLATHYMDEKQFGINDKPTLSKKPAFLILIYPVISMQADVTHTGSREKLLGKVPSQELVEYFSNELHVTEQTPPTFIVHSTDDKAVSVKNSLLFYEALLNKEVYTEMHIYPKGGHGYGLGLQYDNLNTWPDRLFDWLESY